MSREPSDPLLPASTIEMLHRRSDFLRRIRDFFYQKGFDEVQTPVLSADTVVDRFIEPIQIELEVSGSRRDFWLQTSPEFAMKRLLASGAQSIFQIGPVFRQGEAGSQHNPEFTMLEWYRVGDSYEQGRTLLAEFCMEILNRPHPRQISYRDSFAQNVGIDPFTATNRQLSDVLRESGNSLNGANETDRDSLLNMILALCVESNLGVRQPDIVYDWPASQAALAKIRKDEIDVAERFELYVGGVELANGYHELTDADELQSRNERTNDLRKKDGNRSLPVESRMLDAMRSGLPSCCGVAVGVDRLLMVESGGDSIDQVMTFPIDRA